MVNCRKVKFSLQFNMLRDHACPQLNYCNSRGFCAILVALTISAIFLLTRFAKLQSFSFLTNFILIFNFFLVTIFMKKSYDLIVTNTVIFFIKTLWMKTNSFQFQWNQLSIFRAVANFFQTPQPCSSFCHPFWSFLDALAYIVHSVSQSVLFRSVRTSWNTFVSPLVR